MSWSLYRIRLCAGIVPPIAGEELPRGRVDRRRYHGRGAHLQDRRLSPIPNYRRGLYALVGSRPLFYPGVFFERQGWVVGERLPGEVFKKVSMFQILNEKDVKRLHELGVTTDTETFLA